MITKIWEVRAGHITSLLYEREKMKKILNLKNPVDINDKKTIGEIDGAIEFINRHLVLNDNDDKIGIDKNINVNVIHDEIDKIDNLEDLDQLRDYMTHYDSGGHSEADEKMDLLFRKGNETVGKKVRFLINVNAEKVGEDKRIDININDNDKNKDINDSRNLLIIPKKDVITTRRTKDSKAYNEYEEAFQHAMPELLNIIKKSDNDIIVSNSDIVKELGKSFENKTDVSIYMAMRHILFNHGIRVIQCTLKEIDPVTQKGKKGLRLRMLEEGDPLPCSFKRLKKYRR